MADNTPSNAPKDIGKLPEEETASEMPDGIVTPEGGETRLVIDFDSLLDQNAAEFEKKRIEAGIPEGGDLDNPPGDEEKQAEADRLQKQREADEEKERQEEEQRQAAERQQSSGGETAEQKAQREAAEKAEADKKAREQQAPKSAEEIERQKRDSDLDDLEKQVETHVKPTTRKIIDNFKDNAKKARDEAAQARAELKSLQSQLEEAKKSGVPKEVQDEIALLRERVRSVDASQDPAIVKKYEEPIKKNTEFVVDTLVKRGLSPDQGEMLKKGPLTMSRLKSVIDSIETGVGADGKQYTPDPDTADQLREAIRDNARLAKSRSEEITQWQQTYEVRQKQQQENVKKEIDDTNARANERVGKVIARFDFLQKPKDPEANDAPAVKAQKLKAIEEHNSEVLRFAEALKKDTATIKDAIVTAREGVLIREIVVPRLESRLAAALKEVEALRADKGRLRKAGEMARTTSPTPKATEPKETDEDAGLSGDDPFGSVIDSLAGKLVNKS